MMALSGEDKEIRMSDSLAGYNPLDDLDAPPHTAAQDLHHGGAADLHKPTKLSSAAQPRARYRECLKNHAASIGGNVTDGCGEFMPSGEEGTLEALKCAACNCHRNFHRKERGGDSASAAGIMVVHPLQLPAPPHIPSPSSINHHRGPPWGAPTSLTAQPVKMAFGGGGGTASAGTDSSSEELNFNAYQSSSIIPPGGQPPSFVLGKKRYRTKFTQEQKEKMLDFAEKIGWRIPREDDSQLQSFCAEVGVKRQVFKVWMHNNKNSSSSKKQINNNNNHHHQQQQPPGISGI